MESASIIIATCERPERLERMLEYLQRSIAEAGAVFQVIVADNGPAFDSRAVVESFAAKSGLSVDYLCTAPRNKARALNEGIRVARGEWLVFTDDDTLPDVQWLKEGMAFAKKGAFRVFGGRVIPGKVEFDQLPRWMRTGRSGRVPGIGVIVKFEPAQETGTLMANHAAPFGANMFARRDVFNEMGGYDEDLWALCRGWPVGSEDSEFGWRLRQACEAIGYCKEAIVIHPVNYERASLGLHLHHAYYEGWRQPLVFMTLSRHVPLVEPYKIKLIIKRILRILPDVIRGDWAGAADHFVETARLMGTMSSRWTAAYGLRRQSLEERQKCA